MSNSEPTTAPQDQLLSQILNEAKNEDLTGLNDADLTVLSKALWDWAEAVPRGDQNVRVLSSPEGAKGPLNRTVLETAGPDMPFLVDSLLAECADKGFEVRTLFHPIVTLDGGRKASIIQIHLPLLSPGEAERLRVGALRTLADVDVAVSDYQAMRDRMAAEVKRLSSVETLSKSDRREGVDFLEWLSTEHFVFLGCREYKFATSKSGKVLPEEPIMVDRSNLGILRDETANVLSRDSEPLVLTEETGSLLSEPFPLIVAKSTLMSRVHRRVRCDYVGVKRYDKDGRVNGEVRFLGLFTAEAYDETARSIPFIRRRVAKVLASSGATPGGHSEKTLANILETWPRDELFQTNTRTLTPIMMGALHLVGRPRTRLFIRRDPFNRFVSAIVFVPREAYDTDLRQRISSLLVDAYAGRLLWFQPHFDSGPLARVQFQIALEPDHPDPDVADLERRITELSRTWDQVFREALTIAEISEDARDGARGFVGGFNAAYREAFRPSEALQDVKAMSGLSADAPILARAYDDPTDGPERIRVKIYARDGALALSDCVPVFENMGLFVRFETGFPVRPMDKPAEDAPDVYWVHSLKMEMADGTPLDVDAIADAFENAFVAVWRGLADNDKFNGLVLSAGLDWREAALLRALSAYRRQSGMDQPQEEQAQAFLRFPGITRQLVELFAARMDPSNDQDLKARTAQSTEMRANIETALGDVDSIVDDQVLRRTAQLICAIQRTNFYQLSAGGAPRPFISFKVASRELEDLPDPKPFREIFTSSPTVDGVHLRFGPVARGGLRWSDRAADYRTEVLGLVKAQQVKNAVIVPVGSKGGFFPKQLPLRGDRDAWLKAGTDAYKEFITALLGLTDNLDGSDVVHPDNTVIWDGEDPYLVVAADKGTATFSDTANAISEAHGFWLGDAFASGGSVGYDHKKMGITARGAWEAVKRHFREIGKDIQSEPFTVIGVGDMSGDVFGNGMLLSKQIRLLAAFNHMHIFIDPDPQDVEASWAERKRMFDLPRSSWADYNAKLMSKGGGVFERSAKSIPLTPEIKEMTGLSKDAVAPDELIHALLKAEAELLWFGGIGTYVKASNETHAAAGDRSSDALRVDGKELKVKVIGEGANLGMTQAGRIEFALRGGRINTDAIDNSAGVDSSDHEVNIKILAAEAIRLKKLEAKDRNALLAKMTDDVAAHVLAHNYDQTGALTLAEASAKTDHEALGRVMTSLEARGVLNRPLEGLPNVAEFKERGEKGQFLTRPELAVLLAWSKIVLFDDLVASSMPDDPHFEAVSKGYFPSPIDQYDTAIDGHRLKREIIATVVANRTLDMAGPSAILRLRELTGADVVAVTRGLEASRAVLSFDDFCNQVDALDNQVHADLQTDLRLTATSAMIEAAAWFVRSMPSLSIAETVTRMNGPLAMFKTTLSDVHGSFGAARIERSTRAFAKRGAPDALARWASAMGAFVEGLSVVDVAEKTSTSVEDAGRCFYALGDALRLDRLRASARQGLVKAGYWDRIAARRLMADLVRQQAFETEDALKAGGAEAWLASRGPQRRQLMATLTNLGRDRNWSFARFALSADAVRQFMEN
jgi:glutamate dehydrogenase